MGKERNGNNGKHLNKERSGMEGRRWEWMGKARLQREQFKLGMEGIGMERIGWDRKGTVTSDKDLKPERIGEDGRATERKGTVRLQR